MRIVMMIMIGAGLAAAQQVDETDLQIAKLQAALADLQKRYTNEHPDVKLTMAMIDQLKAKRAGAPRVSLASSKNLPDNWWRHEGMVTMLGITPGQKQRMEDVFQQYRLKLIDSNAALEKEEIMLEPLVAADTPDVAKTTAQIDRVANARAELEKARGRMLLGIRTVLEPEQWRKLNSISAVSALPTKLSTKQLPTGKQLPPLPSVTKAPE